MSAYKVECKSIFEAGEGFWVREVFGEDAISYTDDRRLAMKVETNRADIWLDLIGSLAKCKIRRIDLDPFHRKERLN